RPAASRTSVREGPSVRTVTCTVARSGGMRTSCSPRTVMVTSLMPLMLRQTRAAVCAERAGMVSGADSLYPVMLGCDQHPNENSTVRQRSTSQEDHGADRFRQRL